MNSHWKIVEPCFSSREIPKFETLFSLGNGYIGIRGALEEHTPVYKPGTFINGFYETEPIVYGERAYGYPELRQKMIPVTEASRIRIFLGDHPLDLETGEVQTYTRFLDMKAGVLVRELTWRSPGEACAAVRFERLVSFRRPYIAAFKVTVIPKKHGIPLGIESFLSEPKQPSIDSLDPRIGETLKKNPLILEGKHIGHRSGSVRCRTRNSGLVYVCSVQNGISSSGGYSESFRQTEGDLIHRYEFTAPADSEITFEKMVCYTASIGLAPEEIDYTHREELYRAADAGFEVLASEQRKYLGEYWKHADVQITSKENLQDSIRFNLFHLHQAAGKSGSTGIPAKGLTGEGYEGHYFWDTEIYMEPLFLYTKPEIAEQLLLYRYHTLPQARERARTLHHRGALFPWRTINGHEASAYYPAGTAQYHINADIAYAVKKYVSITGDEGFLADYGAEIVFETARFWADLADYVPEKGYCLNEVTGPDEYTACVNNNSYTNFMALDHLEYAVEAAEFLKKNNHRGYTVLAEKLGLTEKEIAKWLEIAAGIYLPERRENGVIPQDDTFLEKALWNFDGTPKENYPLLLHYHPLTIYRFQVLKQPDVVLALFLLGKRFSPEEKRINFNYYDPLTTGDSSLSFCIQSIMAAEIGCIKKAHDYFIKSARMDLDDINKNVKDGIHAAAMGGTWLTLVYGFAGLRDNGDCLAFDPKLPPEWELLSFSLKYRKRVLEITIYPEKTLYRLIQGEPVEISHAGKRCRVTPNKKTVYPVKKRYNSLDSSG